MRRLSLNARTAQDAVSTDQVEVALFYITHPQLDEPVRLSTDPTVRLSDDPLQYGTRSNWMGSNPATEPFYFVIASTELPSDLEDAAASATLILDNVDQDIANVLRSVRNRATVNLAVVLASSPNLIEGEFQGLKLMSVEGDASETQLVFSREPIEEESYPSGRMTKQRFPGVHR